MDIRQCDQPGVRAVLPADGQRWSETLLGYGPEIYRLVARTEKEQVAGAKKDGLLVLPQRNEEVHILQATSRLDVVLIVSIWPHVGCPAGQSRTFGKLLVRAFLGHSEPLECDQSVRSEAIQSPICVKFGIWHKKIPRQTINAAKELRKILPEAPP